MKKVFLCVVVIALLLSFIMITPLALARNNHKNGSKNKGTNRHRIRAGKSNIAHLYLYQKNQAWEILENGAWGKLKYNISGQTFNFVFNGHSLVPEFEYKLIYYPDPWPGNGLICLGTGVADENGNVHIKESVETGNMPTIEDKNCCPDSDCNGDCNGGAKIWLVLSEDVDCDNNKMIGWHPNEYLFEYDLITFKLTDN